MNIKPNSDITARRWGDESILHVFLTVESLTLDDFIQNIAILLILTHSYRTINSILRINSANKKIHAFFNYKTQKKYLLINSS
jgi:hypothetical protein